MIKLNDNNIFIGHIKQLLKDFNLPSCTIITEDNADENFVSGKHYIKGSQLYLSDGEGSLVRKITYNYGKKYLNLTSNLEINNLIYDRETHRYLGKYLRFLRDQKHVDLMSMYNCFDGETFSKNITITIDNDNEIVFKNDDNYIVYQIPITLNALNLKMFDGREIQLGVYIDANDTYVEGSTKKSCRDFVLEKTCKTMRTTSIFKYDALVTLLRSLKDPTSTNTARATTELDTILKDFILNNVDKMYLLVKVLKSDLKSIVILEDSKKYEYVDSKSVWHRQEPSTIARGYYKLPVFPQLFSNENLDNNYLLADRLVEYLTENVICPLSNMHDINRFHVVVAENPTKLPIKSIDRIYGYWTKSDTNNVIYLMQTNKDYIYNIYDMLGYVDKDIENLIRKELDDVTL